jgi:hypothetical protein
VPRQRAGGFVGSVEHHAVEAGVGAARDQGEIGRAVGEQHGDQADAVACGAAERRHGRRGLAREDPELDDVDAGRRHGAHRFQHRRGRQRQVADGGAGRPLPGHFVADRGDGRIGKATQRTLRRLLEVDDVGAAGNGAPRLLGRADAGE